MIVYIEEDHGFAIKPWNAVRWQSIGIKTDGNMAIAMGNYFFTPTKGGDEVKVEYTFAYTKDDKQSASLKITAAQRNPFLLSSYSN